MSVIGTFGLPQLPATRNDNLSKLPKVFLLHISVAAGGKLYEQAKAACTDSDKLDAMGRKLVAAKKCLAYRITELAYIPTSIELQDLDEFV